MRRGRPLGSGRGALRIALATAALAAVAGCDFSKLAFVADHRLHFVTPKSRELIAAPLNLSWTVTDFTVVQPGDGTPTTKAGYFALFVDRAPIKPGQTVAAIASHDRSCRRTPGCPDAQYLADRRVYTTSQLSFTVDQIASFHTRQKTQTHEVVIVLLDSSGRRIGEAAWYRDFRMKKPSFG